MSDNIFKFPKKELDIEVDLEKDEWDDQVSEAVFTILKMNVEGIVNTSDVEWEHVMDAALNIAVGAGLAAGFSIEQMQNAMNYMDEEYEYDA